MEYYILESGSREYELKVFGNLLNYIATRHLSAQLYLYPVEANCKDWWVKSFKQYNGPTISFI